MKQITAKQYAKIRPFLPVRRGNVRIPNIVFINVILYVLEYERKFMNPILFFIVSMLRSLRSGAS